MIITLSFLCFAIFYAWLFVMVEKEVRGSGMESYSPFQKLCIYGIESSLVVSSLGLFFIVAIV